MPTYEERRAEWHLAMAKARASSLSYVTALRRAGADEATIRRMCRDVDNQALTEDCEDSADPMDAHCQEAMIRELQAATEDAIAETRRPPDFLLTGDDDESPDG